METQQSQRSEPLGMPVGVGVGGVVRWGGGLPELLLGVGVGGPAPRRGAPPPPAGGGGPGGGGRIFHGAREKESIGLSKGTTSCFIKSLLLAG